MASTLEKVKSRQSTQTSSALVAKRQAGSAESSRGESHVDWASLRANRLDLIEAGKTKIWKNDLRISELAYFLLLMPALLLMMWQRWSWVSCVASSTIAVVGMFSFSTWMRKRERRLVGHMMFLARHRRRCGECQYFVQDLAEPVCPECGLRFDPNDDRHLILPLINQLYSRQARQIAAVAIPAILIEITLMARSAPVIGHLLCAAGLLVGLHVVFGWTLFEASRSDANGATWQQLAARLGRKPLGEILRLQYVGLLLRWSFLTALCGGMVALMRVDPATLARFGLDRTPMGMYFGLGVPGLVWMAVVIFGYRHVMMRLHHRLRMILISG